MFDSFDASFDFATDDLDVPFSLGLFLESESDEYTTMEELSDIARNTRGTSLIPSKKRSVTSESYSSAQKRKRFQARQSHAKLYATPVYDKCDSLIYFPTKMMRLLNAGDLDGAWKLLNIYTRKGCQIERICDDKLMVLGCGHFIKNMEFIQAVHPDSVMNIQRTRVDGNVIICNSLLTFTNNKFVHNSVGQLSKYKKLDTFLEKTRKEFLQASVNLDKMPESERKHVLQLFDSDMNLLVKARAELRITFDDFTKKIVNMHMVFDFYSVREADSL